MSQSVDPGHFFQSDAAQTTTARKALKSKNQNGSPIRLSSKLLAIAPDPDGLNAVFVAESAGILRRVDLKNRSFNREVYRGPTAPLTSIAFSTDGQTIFSGCWDKSIWAWERSPEKGGTSGRRFEGHSDFVKAVRVVRVRDDGKARDLLISGGQDGKIIVWDASTGDKLHVLTGHARGVLSLAVAPFSLEDERESPATVEMYSGDSTREIRRWRIGVKDAEEIMTSTTGAKNKDGEAILLHETSVNRLHLTDEDGSDMSSTMWSASSDKTAKRSLFNVKTHKWETDTTLSHPDFVRDVLPLCDAGLVATACRDEEVRIWDTASEKVFDTFSGHFEEVTGLALVGMDLVSISIDNTLRIWPGTRAGILGKIEAERKAAEEAEAPVKKGVELDEDEERELAELMEDD